MTENAELMNKAHAAVFASLMTSHERRSGIGALGSVVSHNLAWDAVIALNEAGMLAAVSTSTKSETHHPKDGK